MLGLNYLKLRIEVAWHNVVRTWFLDAGLQNANI